MRSGLRYALLISMSMITLLFTSLIASHGETITYVYDELNRLRRVEYGDGTIIEYIYDNTGNRWERKLQSPDTTPPTGTIDINGGATLTNSTSVTLTLTCTDSSGCSEMRFSNDNVSYSTPEPYAATKAWTLTSGDGTKTVYAKFKDTPGNWSTGYSDAILLDTLAPTGTIIINGGAASTNSTNVTLTLSCSDLQGCSQMQFSNDGITYSPTPRQRHGP